MSRSRTNAALAALAALAACGKNDTGSGGGNCAGVAAAIEVVMRAEMTSDDTGGMPPEIKAKVVDAMSLALPKLKVDLAAACTDDHWPPAAISCVSSLKTLSNTPRCMAMLGPAQRANAEDALATAMKGAEAVVIAATASEHAGGASIPECDQYKAAVEKLITCDKLPREYVNAYRNAMALIDKMLDMATSTRASPEARTASASGCKTQLDQLTQRAASLGCPL